MSVLSWQQERHEAQSGAAVYHFATVGAVYSDGVTLIFPGETAAGGKHYPCASGITFAAGNRVIISKVPGGYVALCPITGGS